MSFSRREFVKFMGGTLGATGLAGCFAETQKDSPFLNFSDRDELV